MFFVLLRLFLVLLSLLELGGQSPSWGHIGVIVVIGVIVEVGIKVGSGVIVREGVIVGVRVMFGS